MSLLKRKCANCRYLADAGLPGNGWCTHPKRQMSSDVRILVRKGELACRNSWGGDLWESPSGAGATDQTTTADDSPSTSPTVANPELKPLQLDDQVTSVRTPDASALPASDRAASGPTAVDDQIVAQTTITPRQRRHSSRPHPQIRESDEVNHIAHAEQRERAQVMARGARDAILRARERHRQRTGRPARIDGAPLVDDGRSVPDEQGSERTTAQSSAPEVAPSAVPPTEDMVLRTRQRVSTESDIDRVQRKYNDATPPVPVSELPKGAESLTRGEDERIRFESVPERRHDIVLPRRVPSGRGGAAGPGRPPTASAEDTGPDDVPPGEPSYERVLEQARQIKAAAKAARERRLSRHGPRLRQVAPRIVEADTTGSEEPNAAPGTGTEGLARSFDEADSVDAGQSGSEEPTGVTSLPNLSDSADFSVAEPAAALNPSEEPIDTPRSAHPHTDEADDSALAPISQGREESSTVEPSTIDWSEADIDRGSRVPSRRRSWLSAFGRRHQDAPPRVAHFPLRPPQTRMSAPGEVWLDERTVDAETTLVTADPALDVQPAGFASPNQALQEDLPPEASHLSAEGQPQSQDVDSQSNESARQGEAENDSLSGDDRPAPPTAPDHEPLELRPSPIRAFRRPHDIGESGEPTNGLADTFDMEGLRERLFGNTVRPPVNPVTVDQRNVVEEHRDLQPQFEPEQTVTLEPDDDAVFERVEHIEAEENPQIDIRAIVARQNDLLDMRVQLAPHLPRICQTCRDFRPAEGGERGWCTNPWAFTHRRMVNAGDRPCQSSIGCWWLPEDGIWLSPDELAALDQPTPLMDAMLAYHDRRRVGER